MRRKIRLALALAQVLAQVHAALIVTFVPVAEASLTVSVPMGRAFHVAGSFRPTSRVAGLAARHHAARVGRADRAVCRVPHRVQRHVPAPHPAAHRRVAARVAAHALAPASLRKRNADTLTVLE